MLLLSGLAMEMFFLPVRYRQEHRHDQSGDQFQVVGIDFQHTDYELNYNIINNSANSNAGAIYFDKGKLVIDKSNFIDNTVTTSSSGKESVIYANDVRSEEHNV